jgi:hypothetical protein
MAVAVALGAKYPFENDLAAKRDFARLQNIMGFPVVSQ